jgi:hypothetical protein
MGHTTLAQGFGSRNPVARWWLSLRRGVGVAVAVLIVMCAGAATVQASVKGPLVYHGGPVLSHPSTTYVVYWQGVNGTLSPRYIGDVAEFIQDWSQTPAHAVLAQYYQIAGRREHVSNIVKYGGTTTDTDAFPRQVLTQGELAHEVRAVVRARGWPESYGANYVVLLPPEVSTDVNACAWHNWVPDPATAKKIFYSIIPYYSGSRLCPMPSGPYPHAEDIDNAVDRVSHELSELATDPWNTELANDPNKRTNTSWYTGSDGHEEEAGDLCRKDSHGVYGARDRLTGADVFLHGRPYLIQGEWSNADNRCSLGLPPRGPLDISYSGQLGELRIDVSTAADISRVLGPPSYSTTGSFDNAPGISYQLFGYGCRGSTCATEYYVNLVTGRLESFVTTSRQFALPGGIRVGMSANDAARRERRPIDCGREGIRVPKSKLLIFIGTRGGRRLSNGDVTGGSVAEIDIDDRSYGVGVTFC